MVKLFEKEDAFCTFAGERDRSWSSNCHVLLALLQDDFRQSYASQIRKTVDFIIEFWWKSDGLPRDKWVSHESLQQKLHTYENAAFKPFLSGNVDGASIGSFPT